MVKSINDRMKDTILNIKKEIINDYEHIEGV